MKYERPDIALFYAMARLANDVRLAPRRLVTPDPSTRFPTPAAAKPSPVPTHERRGPNDCENFQDWRKPAIQLDKEPSIMVREPDATTQPTSQDNQLMSKHRVLSFKPQLRLEWRGQDGQNETEQPDHSASLGDSITSSTQATDCILGARQRFAHQHLKEQIRADLILKGKPGSRPRARRRSAAFSASSRNFDLNGEVRTARTKQNSPIIPPA
jgi:hypothetical protein